MCVCMLLSGQVVDSEKENSDLTCVKGRDVWEGTIKVKTFV